LIDRLWPRGVKKADAAIDQWAKDIAPSTALRKWFKKPSNEDWMPTAVYEFFRT
jgi:uncharacterized protein YeaO (DUF488 family)